MSLAANCKKLCDSGKCDAQCCGPVPFPVDAFNKYAYRAGVKKWEKLELMQDKAGQKYVLAKTKDLDCIFLDKNSCTIYEDRPEVCKLFGTSEELKCPHLTKQGKLRKKQNEKTDDKTSQSNK